MGWATAGVERASMSTAAYTLSIPLTVGVDGTGHDVTLYGDSAGKHLLFDQSANALELVDIDLLITGNTTSEIKNVTTENRHYLSIRADEGGTGDGAGINLYGDDDSTHPDKIIFYSDGDASMTIDGNNAAIVGDLDVDGTTNLDIVDIDGTVQIDSTLTVGVDGDSHDVKFFGTTASTGYLLWDKSQNDLIIGPAGSVGIGTTTPSSTLHVAGNIRTDNALIVEGTNATAIRLTQTDTDGAYISITETDGSTRMGYMGFPSSDNLHLKNQTAAGLIYLSTDSTTRMSISAAGLVNVVGEFTAGTKTFDIPHPTKGGDWRLRHASVEGPRHDLLYRGTATLSGGTATVDLDIDSHMTDGTWEALCTNPWAMVASSGNAVEWSLSGKTLTITSDTADAVCSWMVMAERHDDHVKSEICPSCDDDGHFITEYEKEPDDEPDDEPDEAAEEAV